MIYIRVDANAQIATGHLMRCMSIAHEFRKNDQKVIFIIADKFSCEFLECNNFEYICLNSLWNNLEYELEHLIELVIKNEIDKLIIDSYYVTYHYLSTLSRYTKTIYLDDLARFIYPANMVINYNIYAYYKNYINDYMSTTTKLMLGCEYVPLREEFHSISKSNRGYIEKILITTGGTDNYNLSGKLLRCLCQIEIFKNIEFHVIVGKFYNFKEDLTKLALTNKKIVLHENVKRMSEVMLQCDLAITAGGVTTYELCACRIPMIIYTFADNQLDGAEGFQKAGVAEYCGDIRWNENEVIYNIRLSILHYIDSPNAVSEKIKQMGKLVDGKGTIRIFEGIQDL